VIRARWTLAALLFALLLPLCVGLSRWPFDDAYIHLRVAENLASGVGPYFAAGEHAAASSSPLWTILLAALSLVGLATPVVIASVNALLIAVGAVFACGALFARTPSALQRSVEFGFVSVYGALLLPSAAGLMETPLALALAFGALYAIRHERLWGFVLLGLAAGVRFEMLGFAIALMLVRALTRKRLSSREIGAWILGCAPWLLYQLIAFGQIFSSTIGAKAQVYQLTAVETWRLAVAFFAPSWPAVISSGNGGASYLLWILIGSGLLLGLAAVRLTTQKENALAAPIGLAAIGLIGVYIVTGTLVFPWYSPLVLAPLAAASLSVAQRSHRALALVALLLWVPFVVELAPSASAVLRNRPDDYRYFRVNARVGQYIQVGEALFEAYPAATLLSSEVGGLGYGFRGSILDAVGLTSSGVSEFHPMSVPGQRPAGWVGAIPPALVAQRSPELIVSLELFSGALRRSDLLEGYQQVSLPIYIDADRAAFGVDAAPQLWGGTKLHVWIRNDLDRSRFDAALATR
jgi:hypothetical protein